MFPLNSLSSLVIVPRFFGLQLLTHLALSFRNNTLRCGPIWLSFSEDGKPSAAAGQMFALAFHQNNAPLFIAGVTREGEIHRDVLRL